MKIVIHTTEWNIDRKERENGTLIKFLNATTSFSMEFSLLYSFAKIYSDDTTYRVDLK